MEGRIDFERHLLSEISALTKLAREHDEKLSDFMRELSSNVATITEENRHCKTQREDIEKRTRTMEATINSWTGAKAAIAGIVGLITGVCSLIVALVRG